MSGSGVVERNPLSGRSDKSPEVFPVPGHDRAVQCGGKGYHDRIGDVRGSSATEEEAGVVSSLLVEHGDVAASEETAKLNLLRRSAHLSDHH